jgi:hypothetical protein
MEKKDQPNLAAVKDYDWGQIYREWQSWNSDRELVRPWLVHPAPDLNHDDIGDLVVASDLIPPEGGNIEGGFRSGKPPP